MTKEQFNKRRALVRDFISNNPRPVDSDEREMRFAVIKMLWAGEFAYDSATNELSVMH